MAHDTLIITGHPSPDLDCLAAMAALNYLVPHRKLIVRFQSNPGSHWHDPERDRYTVDVGGGPLDHHQLEQPRSTCAFQLVLAHIAAEGTFEQRCKATALLAALGPTVLRQDSTASLTDPRDLGANMLGLGEVVKRRAWALQNDHQLYVELAPLFHDLFNEIVARDQAPHALDWLWHNGQEVGQCYRARGGCVVGLVITLQVGRFEPEHYLVDALWTAYPTVDLVVTHTIFQHPEGAYTYGCGVTRRPGSAIDLPALVAQVEATATGTVANELRAWHREQWWCGCGGLKHPRADAPAHVLLNQLVQAFAQALSDA